MGYRGSIDSYGNISIYETGGSYEPCRCNIFGSKCCCNCGLCLTCVEKSSDGKTYNERVKEHRGRVKSLNPMYPVLPIAVSLFFLIWHFNLSFWGMPNWLISLMIVVPAILVLYFALNLINMALNLKKPSYGTYKRHRLLNDDENFGFRDKIMEKGMGGTFLEGPTTWLIFILLTVAYIPYFHFAVWGSEVLFSNFAVNFVGGAFNLFALFVLVIFYKQEKNEKKMRKEEKLEIRR